MSICRMGNWSKQCEDALNEQINIEFFASYSYHALYCYFLRDNVGYIQIANYFKKCSDEEREHAEKMMKYQIRRGGQVQLRPIANPKQEFNDPNVENKDLLEGFRHALNLEQKVYNNLISMHTIADSEKDPQFTDFIESEFLNEQIEAINQLSVIVNKVSKLNLNPHALLYFENTFEPNKFLI